LAVLDLLNEKREAIIRIAERHGASNVRVLGSSLAGQAGAELCPARARALDALLEVRVLHVDDDSPVDVAGAHRLTPHVIGDELQGEWAELEVEPRLAAWPTAPRRVAVFGHRCELTWLAGALSPVLPFEGPRFDKAPACS